MPRLLIFDRMKRPSRLIIAAMRLCASTVTAFWRRS